MCFRIKPKQVKWKRLMKESFDKVKRKKCSVFFFSFKTYCDIVISGRSYKSGKEIVKKKNYTIDSLLRKIYKFANRTLAKSCDDWSMCRTTAVKKMTKIVHSVRERPRQLIQTYCFSFCMYFACIFYFKQHSLTDIILYEHYIAYIR